MHPAKSVILFTTASGAGYGLIIIAVLCDLLGLLPRGSAVTLTTLGLALGLVVVGLLSSTFHLGHPERAWRAISQWRTSWLSREGVAALWTFLPVLGWGWFRFTNPDSATGLESGLAVVAALSAIGTLYCTAMIYGSLRPVPAWSNRLTPIVYLVLGPMSGSILLVCLSKVFGFESSMIDGIALCLVVVSFFIKKSYWRLIDDSPAISTASTATGLEGKVELFQAPHTGSNYLMREMGFRIARKHSARLRNICVLVGFAVPAAILIFGLVGPAITALSLVALIAAAIGLVAERFLFFAEAKHAQSLYYGESSV